MTGAFNRLLDAALHIAPGFALNDGAGTTRDAGDVAADLKRAVNALKGEAYDEKTGCFDYARVRAGNGYRELRECTAQLNGFTLARLTRREERLAFWINLYNALVIDAVICFNVRESVTKDLGFFRRAAYCVQGMRFSADDIEHGILRGNRHHPLLFFPQFARDDPRLAFSIQTVDPRIHAALNCASRSCPPIAVYDAEHLDAQLDQAMRAFVNSTTKVDNARAVVKVSPIFQWYVSDFGGRAGVIDWVAHGWSDASARGWLSANRARVRLAYSRYNWSLNGAAATASRRGNEN